MTGLVTLGESLAVLAPPVAGPLRHASTLRLGIGGAESNVAIGVSRLGGSAAWAGRVGDDELGELIVRQLRAEGVDVRGVLRDPGTATSLLIKERPGAGPTRVTYYRRHGPGSRLRPDDLPTELLTSAAVLHVTGITPALSASARAAVLTAVETTTSAGGSVSLDLNYRSALWPPAAARPVLRDLVARADIVFAGDDEARLLGLEGTPVELARALCALGPAQAVVKLGARGAVAVIDEAVHEVPAVPVRAVDPVGAGDAFVAGYLADTLLAAPPARRLATATACGAFAVAVAGDWEGAPSRGELDLLSAGPGAVLR